MRLPTWDHTKVKWDQFRAFHIGVRKDGLTDSDVHGYVYRAPQFVMFETGELICVKWSMHPEHRGKWENLNVSVVSSRDVDCPSPMWTPDGVPIYKAWLHPRGTSAPHLLIDHDTGRVVSLGGYGRGENDPDLRPARFKSPSDIPGAFNATAYFAGPGMAPTSGAPVKVYRPQLHSPELAEQLRTFTDVTRAAMSLMGHPGTKKKQHTSQYATWQGSQRVMQTRTWESQPYGQLASKRALEVDSWTDLNEEELRSFWFNGMSLSPKEYPYLLTEKP